MRLIESWHEACIEEGNPKNIMKLSIQNILLSSLLAYPALALAELAGAPLPAMLSEAPMLGLFATAALGALFAGEYSGSRRTLRVPAADAGANRLEPAAEAFVSSSAGARRIETLPAAL
jgi:hypothetical protein